MFKVQGSSVGGEGRHLPPLDMLPLQEVCMQGNSCLPPYFATLQFIPLQKNETLMCLRSVDIRQYCYLHCVTLCNTMAVQLLIQ